MKSSKVDNSLPRIWVDYLKTMSPYKLILFFNQKWSLIFFSSVNKVDGFTEENFKAIDITVIKKRGGKPGVWVILLSVIWVSKHISQAKTRCRKFVIGKVINHEFRVSLIPSVISSFLLRMQIAFLEPPLIDSRIFFHPFPPFLSWLHTGKKGGMHKFEKSQKNLEGNEFKRQL